MYALYDRLRELNLAPMWATSHWRSTTVGERTHYASEEAHTHALVDRIDGRESGQCCAGW